MSDADFVKLLQSRLKVLPGGVSSSMHFSPASYHLQQRSVLYGTEYEKFPIIQGYRATPNHGKPRQLCGYLNLRE